VYAPPANQLTSGEVGDKYAVERLNYFGNTTPKEIISVSDLSKTTAFQHPFCNFKANNRFYYVATVAITDERVKSQWESKLS
jgi:hypothetical protein